MPNLPRSMLDRYNELLKGSVSTLQGVTAGQLAASDGTVASYRAIVKNALRAGNAEAAELDRAFYNAVRKTEVGSEARLELSTATAPGWTDAEIDAALDAIWYENGEYDPQTGSYARTERFSDELGRYISRMVNAASKGHMESYGKQDRRKPRYARVPSGSETCAWCISIAGLGFQFKTRESASHSHAGCDCVIVPSWGGFGVAGYDPSAYSSRYNDALNDWREGNVPKELKDRIYREMESKSGFNEFNAVLAVMREKYGYK